MVREVFKFIFSAPPATTESRAETPRVRVLDDLPAVPEDQQPVGRIVAAGFGAFVFFGVAGIAFVAIGYLMQTAAPALMDAAKDSAEFVLRPASRAYFLCAIPPAVVGGTIAAWFFLSRFKNPDGFRAPLRAIALSVLLLLAACAPFFMVVKSSVKFDPDAVHINPILGFGVKSYPYTEIKGLRASLTGPAGGWLPGPARFVFAIDFADGHTWSSAWYPYEPEGADDAVLIRFLAKKSGKLAMPAQVL